MTWSGTRALLRSDSRRAWKPGSNSRRGLLILGGAALLIAVAVLESRAVHGDAAEVKRVYDGDTIEVLVSGRREKVRYIGIDTPEMGDTREPVRAMAVRARDVNRGLVGGRTVRLQHDVQLRDNYGRLLAYVWLGDTLVNEELVLKGLAAARSFPPNVLFQERLRAAQIHAQQVGAGLWDGRLDGIPLRQQGGEAARETSDARPGDGLRLDAFDANRHVGRIATVCGTVADGRFLGGDGLTFLNLERPYPDQPFTIVIPIEARRGFEGQPETRLRGRDVCVAGRIELHRGRPQIMVYDPAQLDP